MRSVRGSVRGIYEGSVRGLGRGLGERSERSSRGPPGTSDLVPQVLLGTSDLRSWDLRSGPPEVLLGPQIWSPRSFWSLESASGPGIPVFGQDLASEPGFGSRTRN